MDSPTRAAAKEAVMMNPEARIFVPSSSGGSSPDLNPAAVIFGPSQFQVPHGYVGAGAFVQGQSEGFNPVEAQAGYPVYCNYDAYHFCTQKQDYQDVFNAWQFEQSQQNELRGHFQQPNDARMCSFEDQKQSNAGRDCQNQHRVEHGRPVGTYGQPLGYTQYQNSPPYHTQGTSGLTYLNTDSGPSGLAQPHLPALPVYCLSSYGKPPHEMSVDPCRSHPEYLTTRPSGALSNGGYGRGNQHRNQACGSFSDNSPGRRNQYRNQASGSLNDNGNGDKTQRSKKKRKYNRKTMSESTTKPMSEPQTKPELEPKPEPKHNPKPEPKAKPEPKSKPELKPRSNSCQEMGTARGCKEKTQPVNTQLDDRQEIAVVETTNENSGAARPFGSSKPSTQNSGGGAVQVTATTLGGPVSGTMKDMTAQYNSLKLFSDDNRLWTENTEEAGAQASSTSLDVQRSSDALQTIIEESKDGGISSGTGPLIPENGTKVGLGTKSTWCTSTASLSNLNATIVNEESAAAMLQNKLQNAQQALERDEELYEAKEAPEKDEELKGNQELEKCLEVMEQSTDEQSSQEAISPSAKDTIESEETIAASPLQEQTDEPRTPTEERNDMVNGEQEADTANAMEQANDTVASQADEDTKEKIVVQPRKLTWAEIARGAFRPTRKVASQ